MLSFEALLFTISVAFILLAMAEERTELRIATRPCSIRSPASPTGARFCRMPASSPSGMPASRGRPRCC
ncbi:MAG: hypothetical protein P8Y71_10245 [Pseudolabrys sp.]